MYNQFFGFSECPFENNLDQKFIFLSEDHKEVLAALLYFLKENKPFAILCGDVGTGKTMVLNYFIDRLPASYHPIIISNPAVEYREILDYVAQTLGIDSGGKNMLRIVDEVKDALMAAYQEEQVYFLVIDEAHLLSDRSLDDIRLLSNIETPDRKLLQILLVGQYELSYKLQRPEMRQLRQRISINRFLSSLDFDETARYIDHRLKMVGSRLKTCFENNCLALIYTLTDGVPRRINQVCDNALLICKAEERRKITKKILRKADKALRSDLIFTPKTAQGRKRSTGAFSKRLRPPITAGLLLILLLGLLSLVYSVYFGGTGTYQAPDQHSETAPVREGRSGGHKAEEVVDPKVKSIAGDVNGEQRSGFPDSGSREAPLVPEKEIVAESQEVEKSLSATDVPEIAAPDVEHEPLDDYHEMPAVVPTTIMVRKKDTLSSIAVKHFPDNIESGIVGILKANPTITDKNLIYPGQILVLPESGKASRPASATGEDTVAEFTIQVCTLLHSSKAVAEDYAAQLIQRGYPVFIKEKVSEDGNRMYKICIGQYKTETEAIEAALYFQEKEGRTYVIIKTDGDAFALPSRTESVPKD
ncbi:MAG: AAA family ATPase [Deltaproteobacteria bacterium]|nr:AAA family ATPase [Deltaproteobacteria bacterium]